jgi:hypothetical protein
MTDRAPLPVETLGRLQKALDSHRRRAEKMGLPAHDIRVAALLAKSRTDSEGYYLCYSTGVRLRFSVEAVGEDDKATIGHVFPLSAPDPNDMHPGHTLDNVELESWGNNQAQNHEQDTPFISKGKRFAVREDRPAKPSKWPVRKLKSGNKLPTNKDREKYLARNPSYRKGKLNG